MGRIRLLSESTINQIAAGEVIENPASIVKELVENSLDAGAKKIQIEIQGGGFQLITLADDGYGMGKDDALLAFERHATSKIRNIDDVNRLDTMGFRGEALASIAAIAKVELVTAEEHSTATKIVIEGGKILSCSAASRAYGTTVAIRSLFYNTPARKKFQKSAAASLAAIHKLVFALALARPDVGFELLSGEEQILSVPPETDSHFLNQLESRIKALASTDYTIPTSYTCGNFTLHALLAPTTHAKATRSGQYIFINHRPIRSPLISAAVKVGYGHRLDEKRFPSFILHLTIPTDSFDVNVHPQKREVRFHDEALLKNSVQKAIQATFHAPLPAISRTASTPFPTFPLSLREELETPAIETVFEEPTVIGLYGPYLLLAEPNGIVWVHLRTAQEALLRKEAETKLPSQTVLFPIPLHLSSAQALDVELHQETLSTFGFTLERSGKETFFIHALPSCLNEGNAQEAIELILSGKDVSRRFAQIAFRGKTQFLLREALAVWHQIKGHVDATYITRMSTHEIERLFR